jgi:hypothetical protein
MSNLSDISSSLNQTVNAFSFMSTYFPFTGGKPFYVEGGKGTMAYETAIKSDIFLELGQLARRNNNVLIIKNPNQSSEDGFYTSWAIHNNEGNILASGINDYEAIIIKKIKNFYGVV